MDHQVLQSQIGDFSPLEFWLLRPSEIASFVWLCFYFLTNKTTLVLPLRPLSLLPLSYCLFLIFQHNGPAEKEDHQGSRRPEVPPFW